MSNPLVIFSHNNILDDWCLTLRFDKLLFLRPPAQVIFFVLVMFYPYMHAKWSWSLFTPMNWLLAYYIYWSNLGRELMTKLGSDKKGRLPDALSKLQLLFNLNFLLLLPFFNHVISMKSQPFFQNFPSLTLNLLITLNSGNWINIKKIQQKQWCD